MKVREEVAEFLRQKWELLDEAGWEVLKKQLEKFQKVRILKVDFKDLETLEIHGVQQEGEPKTFYLSFEETRYGRCLKARYEKETTMYLCKEKQVEIVEFYKLYFTKDGIILWLLKYHDKYSGLVIINYDKEILDRDKEEEFWLKELDTTKDRESMNLQIRQWLGPNRRHDNVLLLKTWEHVMLPIE